jgi:hypothetical protein
LIIIILVLIFYVLILSIIIILVLVLRGIVFVWLSIFIETLIAIWIKFLIIWKLISLIIRIIRLGLKLLIRHKRIYLLQANLLSLSCINIIERCVIDILEIALVVFVISKAYIVFLFIIIIVLVITCILRLRVTWLPWLGINIRFLFISILFIYINIIKSRSKWIMHTFSFDKCISL